jgi:uncharacterized protein
MPRRQCCCRDARFRKTITMKDAKSLLLEFVAAVTRGQNAAALFAEDGAVELPFLYSLGIPWRHRGRQAISKLQDSLAGFYLDFGFPPEDSNVLIRHPGAGVRRIHGPPDGEGDRAHRPSPVYARLVAENGQIKLVRESLNPFAVGQALLPGGVKDLPDPEKVIFSSSRTTGAEAVESSLPASSIIKLIEDGHGR